MNKGKTKYQIQNSKTDITIFVDESKLIMCESTDKGVLMNYGTHQNCIESISINQIEEKLNQHSFNFISVSNQYLININHIEHVQDASGNSIVMSNGFHVPISQTKKATIIELLSKHYK